MTKAPTRLHSTLFIPLEGTMYFLYRDERSRAQHIFEGIMGLTWPCNKSFLERRELYRRFDEGWVSGDLVYLSEVLVNEIDSYQKALEAM